MKKNDGSLYLPLRQFRSIGFGYQAFEIVRKKGDPVKSPKFGTEMGVDGKYAFLLCLSNQSIGSKCKNPHTFLIFAARFNESSFSQFGPK